MIKYKLIIFLLFTNTALSQEKYEAAEGFYNFSSFEVVAGIYLLQDKTFFYYASFGNVDLKVYGTYLLSNQNICSLHVNKELLKEFYFYGYNNEKETDSITLHYDKPYARKAEKLYVIIDGKLKRLPEFVSDSSSVSISLKSPKAKIIKIGYESLENESNLTVERMTELTLDEGVNEIKIYHNYYFDMTTEIASLTLEAKNGTLTDHYSSSRTIQKKEISEKTRNEVRDFIQNQKNRNSITRDGKVYQKI